MVDRLVYDKTMKTLRHGIVSVVIHCSGRMCMCNFSLSNKGRFCNTIASVALAHTSIQND